MSGSLIVAPLVQTSGVDLPEMGLSQGAEDKLGLMYTIWSDILSQATQQTGVSKRNEHLIKDTKFGYWWCHGNEILQVTSTSEVTVLRHEDTYSDLPNLALVAFLGNA